MRVTSTLTKGSLAAAALVALASAGCGDLAAIAQDILNRADAGTGATCVYEGVAYAPGESFKSNDGCNTCQCDKSGTIGCTKIGCTSPPNSASCLENKTPYYAECMDPGTLQKLAQDDCSKQNRTLGALNFFEDCGNKTFHYGTYACCDRAGSAQTCTKVDGGGGASSCKPMSTWKTYGAEACSAQGMALSDISYQSGCDKTGENFANAVYVCCGPTSTPPPTPPTTCEKVDDGGPTSCKSQATWKTYGGDRCKGQGMTLTDVYYFNACDETGDNFRNVTYICCGPASTPTPPTPPPFPCTKVGGGGGPGSCKPLSVWKGYGGEACASLGMSLSSYSGQGACDETGESFQDAVYVCCGGTADPSGIRCSTGANADGTKCDSCWDSSGALVKTSCAANQ